MTKTKLDVKTIRKLKKQIEAASVKPVNGMFTVTKTLQLTAPISAVLTILQLGGKVTFTLPEGKGFKKYQLKMEEIDADTDINSGEKYPGVDKQNGQ
jgi:hypothetical protein